MPSSSRRTVLLAAVAAAFLLPLVPGLVAASSTTSDVIRGLNSRLLYIAVPIAVLVEVILVYAVVRFRTADEPEPTRENRQLEITWTVATGLVLLFVGTASFTALTSPYVGQVPTGLNASADGHAHAHGPSGIEPGSAPPGTVEVVAVGEQWDWTFRYPGENVTSDELVLPRGSEVYLYVTSEDVLHSVHVPALALKQDAFPGQYGLIHTRPTATGTYRLYCAEFCGVHHADMEATVRVVDADRFGRWLERNGTASATAAGRVAGVEAP